MTDKKVLPLVAACALVALPVLLAAKEAVSFHSRYRSSGWIVSSGEEREYSLYVPRTYAPQTPAPLVISMPGAGLWGSAQEEISRWDAVAERERLIVVYPTAKKSGGTRAFHVGDGPDPPKDVRYIADLIDMLQSRYAIDRRRIYANGLSNGGGMAFVLSCTMPDRIAAVGAVSGAQLLPWRWCTDTHPVPMVAFHGTADRAALYAGGRTWISPEPFPNIPMWVANWARRNRCAPDPIDAPVAPDVTKRSYRGCAEDADVELYTLQGGGHEWPGGGPLPEWLCGPFTHTIDATAEMWAFFSRHPLR